MPRDLFSSPSSDSPSPKELSLVASPESQTPTPAAIAKGFNNDNDDPQLEGESPGWENEDGSSGGRNHFLIRHEDSMKGTAAQLLRGRGAQQANHADDLHPFVQTLSWKDLESCVALEDACFEEHERESRETITTHLTTSPELTLGLFSSVPPPTPTNLDRNQIPTYPHAHPPDSDNPSRKAVLLGMIIATKTSTATARGSHHTTATTAAPSGDRIPTYDPTSRTIQITTLAILPHYQKKGLGKVLVKSYQQRMEGSGIAERMVLLGRRVGEMGGGGEGERVRGVLRRWGFEEMEGKGEGEKRGDMAYEFAGEEGG